MIRRILFTIFGIITIMCIASAIISTIYFRVKCETPLRKAALAETLPEAKVNLDKAIQFVEQNQLTTGYSSLFFKEDEYNITKWYAMLKSAQSELNILDVNGYDKVEELDALIVLLIKLTDIPENKQCVFLNDIVFISTGDIVFVPTGIQLVPLYESIWIVFLFSITICTILGMTVYMEKD